MIILKQIEIEKVDMACNFFLKEYANFQNIDSPEVSSQGLTGLTSHNDYIKKREEGYLKLERLKIFIFTNLLALLEQKGLTGARVYARFIPMHKNLETMEMVMGRVTLEYITPNNIFKHTLAKKHPDIEGLIEKCKECLNTEVLLSRKDFLNVLYIENYVGQKTEVKLTNRRKLTFQTNRQALQKINTALSRYVQISPSISKHYFMKIDNGEKYIEQIPSQIEKEVLDTQLKSGIVKSANNNKI